ncbi:hypothetical protein ACSGOQ_006029 [Escherichia coli]|nr:hypothetical protein [Escherichia coli]
MNKRSKFYQEYFTKQKRFTKKYFTSSHRPVASYKRPNTNYLTGGKFSAKFELLMREKNIKMHYAETRKNSSIICSDFLEYGCLTYKFNDVYLYIDVDCNSTRMFEISIHPNHNRYININLVDKVLIGISSTDGGGFEFIASKYDEDFVLYPVLDDVKDILNSLKGSQYKLSEEQLFQYSLIHDDIEIYLECARILEYLYNELTTTGKVTAFTLYNM